MTFCNSAFPILYHPDSSLVLLVFSQVNLKIVCKENFKYEVQEKSPANQAVTMQQLAEEYWR